MSPSPRKPWRSTGEREDTYRAELRLLFFEAVDEVVPDAVDGLIQEVGPVFRRLAAYLKESEPLDYHASAGGLKSAADRRKAAQVARPSAGRDRILQRAALQEDLLTAWKRWAEPCHLHRDRWVLDHVLTVLRYHHAWNLDPFPGLGYAGAGVAYSVPVGPHTAPEYRVDRETRAEYLGRVDAYIREVEEAAAKAGWEERPHKPSTRMHLGWLARFQVLEETVHSISESPLNPGRREEGLDPRAIERALKEMAELLGLTRRTI